MGASESQAFSPPSLPRWPRTLKHLRLPAAILIVVPCHGVCYGTSAAPTRSIFLRLTPDLCPAIQMKVLFVSPSASAYGSERSMLALLRARSFEAEVVCPAGGALERELRILDVPVHPLEFGKHSLRQNPLWHLGFYRRFQAILRRTRPHAVVINLDGNTPLATLAAVQSRIPIVRFCRFEFRPPTRRLDRWCWRQARAIICPSDTVKQQVQAWADPELRRRVHRLYDAYAGGRATPEAVAAFRREIGVGGERLIGCVGRLHRGKRLEVALRAFARLRPTFPQLRLVFIGGDDGSAAGVAYRAELNRLADELGLAEAAIWTGHRPAEAMPAAMAAMSVVLLTSESESFGMVLTEAWAQGVPTVASDVGGCAEITRTSGGGRLAPVGDDRRFAHALRELLASPEVASDLGAKGARWVKAHCSPNHYSQGFDEVLSQIA